VSSEIRGKVFSSPLPKWGPHNDLKGVSAYWRELVNLPAPHSYYCLPRSLQVKEFLAGAHNIWRKVQGKAGGTAGYGGAGNYTAATGVAAGGTTLQHA
jgi:hypothetical protein